MSKNIMLDNVKNQDDLPEMPTRDIQLSNALSYLDFVEENVNAIMEGISRDPRTYFLRSELTEVNEKLIDIKKRILFVKYSLST